MLSHWHLRRAWWIDIYWVRVCVWILKEAMWNYPNTKKLCLFIVEIHCLVSSDLYKHEFESCLIFLSTTITGKINCKLILTLSKQAHNTQAAGTDRRGREGEQSNSRHQWYQCWRRHGGGSVPSGCGAGPGRDGLAWHHGHPGHPRRHRNPPGPAHTPRVPAHWPHVAASGSPVGRGKLGWHGMVLCGTVISMLHPTPLSQWVFEMLKLKLQ